MVVYTDDLSLWQIQDFHKEDAEQGVWGTVVPRQGPGAEPRWGPPGGAGEIVLNSRFIRSENFNIKK